VRGLGPASQTFPPSDRFVLRRGDLSVLSAGERSATDSRSSPASLPANGADR
jgi:hypothetical protein